MTRYSIEPRTSKYIKGYIFISFARNLSNKFGKQLLDTATKTGLNTLKTSSKTVVDNAAEATVKFMGNKIAEKFLKSKPVIYENLRNVEGIIIPP